MYAISAIHKLMTTFSFVIVASFLAVLCSFFHSTEYTNLFIVLNENSLLTVVREEVRIAAHLFNSQWALLTIFISLTKSN